MEVDPPCPHFPACGGCTLQHWPDARYQTHKRDLLVTALRRAGFAEPLVAPLARTSPGERRRMDFAARRIRDRVILGLHRHRSPDVVDLETCLVLHPTLVALLPPLRRVLARLQALHREGSVIVNLLDSGPDVLLRTDRPLPIEDRIALSDFAHAHALPRIAWARASGEPEPVAVLRPPTTTLSGVSVTPPPGAFLQASGSGLSAIVAAVCEAVPAKGEVAEVFAGCGSITFALAKHARVTAWEGDDAAATALRVAANHAGLAGRITVTQRDLVRQPLQAKELSRFAAIVLDPPFAGAGPQVAQIVAAQVPVVIYASCNPATLSRDARVLHQSGYTLRSAVPIDQFLWSERLESVCAFTTRGRRVGR